MRGSPPPLQEPHLRTLIRSRGTCCERREAPLDFTATSTPSPCRLPLPRPMVRHTEPSHLLPLWCSIGFITNRRKVLARSTTLVDPKIVTLMLPIDQPTHAPWCSICVHSNPMELGRRRRHSPGRADVYHVLDGMPMWDMVSTFHFTNLYFICKGASTFSSLQVLYLQT
jgi:hypothetical protein